MKVIGRSDDVVLLGGLILALLVIFSQAVENLLEFFRSIEEGRGLRLFQALLIILTVFVFHQVRKRQLMHAAASHSAAAVRQATERAAELERLVAFGHGIARSLDDEAIQAVATAHIPLLAPGREAWALVRSGEGWRPLTAARGDRAAAMASAAELALEDAVPAAVTGEFTCFPMIVAGTPVGVLGVVAEPALTDQQRRILTAAASLLAVSLKNADLFRDLHENSVRDSLTGCFNRRHALEVMDSELRRARRSHMPLSLLMFDLDHFKRINDRYGHLAGDAVLAAVGARMKAVLRGSDLKCRYGGEEFLVLLPDTPLAGAQHVADTLRRALDEQPVRWHGLEIPVTASIGITRIMPGEVDPQVIMARADSALYLAKAAGRNCLRTVEDVQAVA